MKISPLAPKTQPTLPSIEGVRLQSVEAGIKYRGRKDLLLMVFDKPCPVAGIFTQSKCPGAPVSWGQKIIAGDKPEVRAIVVNSGNANAFTGKKGDETTKVTAQTAAKAANCSENQVLLASTGVIGEPLDPNSFCHHLEKMNQDAAADGWSAAAEAIMTTDTYPKAASTSFDIDGIKVTINGIAKGSGMIAPDMATMLSFIVTDCAIEQNLLQILLSELGDSSFNAITVDSDTSTSDTVLLAATGTASNPVLSSADDPRTDAFRSALRELMTDLALQIVRDGEGATKLVEVVVNGAVSNSSAKVIALSIANSPLVKTAIAGEDANWGRVVMAVGKAGEPADRDSLAISFGDVRVAVNGERDPDYSEDAASAVMKNYEITITTDIGLGNGSARVWTCDLTKEYVAINGDYRS